jgi:hypothetical protein
VIGKAGGKQQAPVADLAWATFTMDAPIVSQVAYEVKAEIRDKTCVAWLKDLANGARLGAEVSAPCHLVAEVQSNGNEGETTAAAIFEVIARVLITGLAHH